MNKISTALAGSRDYINGKTGLVFATLMFSPFGAALAQVADPSTDIVTEVNKGKGYGVAVAVAFVVACWAITSVYMAKRKS